MHAVYGFAGVRRCYQLHIDVNAANDQDAFFRFYFTDYFCRELAVTSIDLTRLQRASKCAEHSTSG